MQFKNQEPETKIIKNINLPDVTKRKLKNGIDVYLLSTKVSELSSVNIIYNKGLWNQEHLLQGNTTVKMLNKGTESHSAKEIADYYDFHSIRYKASVSMHNIVFKNIMLNKYLDKAIAMQKEILTTPIFNPKEFKIYKNNRKESLTIDLEEVENVARFELQEQIYGKNHPYGWHALPEDFDTLQIDWLKDYYKKNIISSKLKIVAVTNDYDNLIGILNDYFGEFKKNKEEKDDMSFKIETEKKYNYIEKEDSLQAAIRTGWKLFGKNHSDYIDMLIVNTLLGGYYGARLMQNIRQKLGLTYGIYSLIIGEKYDGTFEIASEVKKEAKDRVLDEIVKEINKLRTKKVSESELDKLRRYFAGSLLRGIDGEFGYYRKIIGFLAYGTDFDFYTRLFKRINEITPEEIMALANKYLNPDEMYTTIVG